MASTRYFFLPSILLSLITFQHSPSVQADEALISSVCSKTQASGYCRLCFSYYPESRSETLKGLAGLTINCTINQSATVHNILDHYNHSTQVEEFRKCVVIYNGIKNILADAMFAYIHSEFVNAGLLLDSAKTVHQTCFELLVNAKRYIPGELATAFYTFREFDDVAKNVLSQIK